MSDPEGKVWNGMKWAVSLICLLNWASWFRFVHRYWGQIEQNGSAIAAVALLAFFPFPCILMFRKRETSSPYAAFFTYLLLSLALGVKFGR
jgi:hypothetical protein